MTYLERERYIAECRKVLPYPISFYDRQSDGSIWNIYQKHVVNGIPIDKRGRKAKEQNDLARAAEQQATQEGWVPGDWQHNYLVANGFISPDGEPAQPQEEYQQITMQEYMEAMQPAKPKIVKSANGCWWRLNDAGTYDWIPDSELDDVLAAFGIIEDEVAEEVPEHGRQLTLKKKGEN